MTNIGLYFKEEKWNEKENICDFITGFMRVFMRLREEQAGSKRGRSNFFFGKNIFA